MNKTDNLQIEIREKAIFSLFHHDLNANKKSINSDILFGLANKQNSKSIHNLASSLYEIVTNAIENYSDKDISLTLTGGMDSRVILACLLKAGIKPVCFTYGNKNAKDVVFAKKMAEHFDLTFHNPANETPDKDWYYHWVKETIIRDNGNSHLHRAHRTAAIAEHTEMYKPKVLFTGHMGGEGLRGLSYNNYFSSPFFEWVNEGEMLPLEAAKKVLHNYFIKTDLLDWQTLIDDVMQLSWMKHDKQTNKFNFLYDLVGKIHHAQDIRLYKSYVPEVVPVFLQQSYLEALFSSQYHFLTKKQGLWGRLQNPYVHSKMIEYLYPKLLDYPLVNGYSPREYLKGLWYYAPVKLYRDYFDKKKYAPTFSYGKWYVDFIKEHSANIDPAIWEIYNKERYMDALNQNNHAANEGYWHKFSNPVFFDLKHKILKQ